MKRRTAKTIDGKSVGPKDISVFKLLLDKYNPYSLIRRQQDYINALVEANARLVEDNIKLARALHKATGQTFGTYGEAGEDRATSA